VNNQVKYSVVRITTVPISLKKLLEGQLRFMSENGLRILGVSSKGKELEEVSKEEGVVVYELNMTRMITPLKDLKSLWEFFKLCKKEKPTIVHSHTPKAGIIGMLGAKMAGVPIRIHTVAGLPLMEAQGGKRKVLDLVEKLTYWASTKVYPNSKGLYEFILKNKYTSSRKLKVIANGSSNGINTKYFSISQVSQEKVNSLKIQLGIQLEDFVFIFVGRLVSDKGLNELVESFKSLCAELCNSQKIKLILVGSFESDLDPLNEVTLKEIENNPNIITVGFQKDVRPYFAISHALVFPSYREGFPNVVMQAGAMDLPAIVSDINGCNEIIEEDKNGVIIPVKNVEAITSAMRKMVTNIEFYSHLKLHTRMMITERYEQQVVWEALLTEYENLIQEKE
jgi:Glycosyltransferase